MRLGIKTCTLDMSFEEMLRFCVEQGLETLEIGTGNWSSAPHIDLDKMVESDAARDEWYGKIKDADGLKKSIKEEWSDFIVTQSEQGAQTANPPQNTGGAKMTMAEIYKKDDQGRYVLSTAERQKALIENSKTN